MGDHTDEDGCTQCERIRALESHVDALGDQLRHYRRTAMIWAVVAFGMAGAAILGTVSFVVLSMH